MVHDATAVEWTTADGGIPVRTVADANPYDAANECPHGSLATDRRITCSCFGGADVIEFPTPARAPALDEAA